MRIAQRVVKETISADARRTKKRQLDEVNEGANDSQPEKRKRVFDTIAQQNSEECMRLMNRILEHIKIFDIRQRAQTQSLGEVHNQFDEDKRNRQRNPNHEEYR